MNFSGLTAVDVLSRIKNREISVLEYVEELLGRCERYSDLNAFIYLNPYKVKEAARHADQMMDSEDSLGALHGLPVVVKDNIDTAEMPTTAGTPALKNHNPSRNAGIVQSLIDAGAIIFAKANLHELAFGITTNNAAFGPARNPYHPGFIPGGSSGGCGTAVGARLAPVGIGTDTGGSIRIPSALCGIVGFRPTVGRYSQKGIVPISHTRDTAGPMTRSVQDVELLDRVITGRKTILTAAKLKGVRIGIPRFPFFTNIHPAVADAVGKAIGRLENYGIEMIEADMPDVESAEKLAGFPIALYEFGIDLKRYLASHSIPLEFSSVIEQIASPDVKSILKPELFEDAMAESLYMKAINIQRPALQAAYKEYFEEHNLSAMVLPTTPLPATPVGIDDTVILNGTAEPIFNAFCRNTSPGSIAGIPGISLPIELSQEGLPIGLEMDGAFGKDDRILEIALGFEQLYPPLTEPNLP